MVTKRLFQSKTIENPSAWDRGSFCQDVSEALHAVPILEARPTSCELLPKAQKKGLAYSHWQNSQQRTPASPNAVDFGESGEGVPVSP